MGGGKWEGQWRDGALVIFIVVSSGCGRRAKKTSGVYKREVIIHCAKLASLAGVLASLSLFPHILRLGTRLPGLMTRASLRRQSVAHRRAQSILHRAPTMGAVAEDDTPTSLSSAIPFDVLPPPLFPFPIPPIG